MKVHLLKAKLHRLQVTAKSLDYEGSLKVDPRWMEEVGLLPFEYVEVYNVTQGTRWSTYLIPGQWGDGEVALHGAAARLGEVGDLLIVAAYVWLDPEEVSNHRIRIAIFEKNNALKEIREESVGMLAS